MNNKGFSLIELIIVVTIIGILAMVGIPAYLGQQTSATRTEAYKNLESLRLLEEQFLAENAAYTAGAGDIPSIIALLPGFQPGPETGAGQYYTEFNYQIVQNFAIDTPVTSPPTWGTAQTPCFTAIATGRAGSRVDGEIFAVDCNGNRNY